MLKYSEYRRAHGGYTHFRLMHDSLQFICVTLFRFSLFSAVDFVTPRTKHVGDELTREHQQKRSP